MGFKIKGASAASYALLTGLISVVTISAVFTTGGKIKGIFDKTNETMAASMSPTPAVDPSKYVDIAYADPSTYTTQSACDAALNCLALPDNDGHSHDIAAVDGHDPVVFFYYGPGFFKYRSPINSAGNAIIQYDHSTGMALPVYGTSTNTDVIVFDGWNCSDLAFSAISVPDPNTGESVASTTRFEAIDTASQKGTLAEFSSNLKGVQCSGDGGWIDYATIKSIAHDPTVEYWDYTNQTWVPMQTSGGGSTGGGATAF